MNKVEQDYELILTSYPGCEDFVVEIWMKNNLIAIVKEKNEIQQFHSQMYQDDFDRQYFAETVNRAREMLGSGHESQRL